MKTVAILSDLFAHNDWANRKLLKLCEGLTDSQLDQAQEMGFGTLRNTVFHILEAENLWLERWQHKAPRALVSHANGQSVAELVQMVKHTARQRNQWLAEMGTDDQRAVSYIDTEQQPWTHALGDLMIHVTNHGIHHRAQVLNFLRIFDRRIPAGVDYLFWKMACPSCEQPAGSLGPLREYGLEVATESGWAPVFDSTRIHRYFEYGDWAMRQVMRAAGELKESQLDQEFALGMGSLRKNLQHMIDAERWWFANWAQDQAVFPRGEEPRSLEGISKPSCDGNQASKVNEPLE